MKRIFVLAALLLAFPPAARLAAQDPQIAELERQQAEERHRSMTTRLEGLEASIAAFQKSVTALRDEVRHVKDEIDRLKNKNEGAATQESIKKLAQAIEEVDKKRITGEENTVKQFESLRKFILAGPAGARLPTPPANGGPEVRPRSPGGAVAAPGGNVPSPGGNQPGWKYTIQPNDSFGGIIARLKKERGIIITLKQLQDANPGVNSSNLKIGQVIFIPQP